MEVMGEIGEGKGVFICQPLCLLACLGAQIVQGKYFWQILSASQATNTLTLWRNTAKILPNILELFKKYYWQIDTASQMLIQQQLLVLVFCRKARGFTFRNISLSKFQPFDDSGPTLSICYSHPVTKYCIPDFWNQLVLLPDFWIQSTKDFS